jgi:hypothetical protein
MQNNVRHHAHATHSNRQNGTNQEESNMIVSIHSQRTILWWGVTFMVIFGLAWWFLLGMVPPPPPTLSPAEVAAYYTEHATQIKIGAVIASWTSACMVPFSLVIAFQLARIEEGKPIWATLSLVSGALMSMFLVFPPILWGIIAFEPTRSPEITSALNQMANLTLVTTDQFYIFQMIAIWVVSLKAKPDPLNPFPRWLGWMNLWIAVIFEVGAPSFMFKTGPFAWNGLFVFWFPFTFFFFWQTTMYISMFKALRRQEEALQAS